MRKVLFWLHLIAGTMAGIVIFIMCVTGVLLMYEKQMILWADTRDLRLEAASPLALRLPLEQLVARVRNERQVVPTSLTVWRRPDAPVQLSYGRDAIYADPYSGRILGEGSASIRRFFRFVTDWHRWLAAPTENRAAGKAITGASNLAFLFIVVSGLYLWLPRGWRWRHLRPVVWFKRGLSGKARDFNWHNAIGIWCFTPLFFIVISATVISYPWASNLAYRIAGGEPPAAGAKGGGAEGGRAEKGEGRKKGANGERGERPGGAPGGPGGSAAPPGDLDLTGLDAAWKLAESKNPAWKAITLRMPVAHHAPWLFTIDAGHPGQPQLRGTLTVDRETGAVARWEPFDSLDRGRRFRTWLRFVHTGEYYGLIGQTIAGIASAGGAVLVFTGLSLTWRRLRAWRVRRSRARQPQEVRA
jgi:uncharacterized iron-regulated membrane protein